MTSNDRPATPTGADAAEAARLLRAALEALPPRTAVERATARRIEGAAVALEALAGRESARRAVA